MTKINSVISIFGYTSKKGETVVVIPATADTPERSRYLVSVCENTTNKVGNVTTKVARWVSIASNFSYGIAAGQSYLVAASGVLSDDGGILNATRVCVGTPLAHD